MKSKKELEQIKEEVEAVSEQLRELTDEELAQVTGGVQTNPHEGLAVPFDIQSVKIADLHANIGLTLDYNFNNKQKLK